MDNLRG
ncbi:hypothetical protein VCHC81A2_2144, partial [Vibrio cholerae HC-81A2]